MACHLLVRRVASSTATVFSGEEGASRRLLGARGGNKEQAGGPSSRDDDHVGFHFIFPCCHVEDSKLVTINLYFYADITLFS